MINNYLCDDCELATICVPKAKLKPFTEDAKTDLGLDISIDNCKNYKAMTYEVENND